MNITSTTVKTYAVNDPWPKYTYRASCVDCGAVVAESVKSMASAMHEAQSHQC